VIDVVIRAIRRRLASMIATVRGEGYRLRLVDVPGA
jgi:DNA-binding response OmpR family regulator